MTEVSVGVTLSLTEMKSGEQIPERKITYGDDFLFLTHIMIDLNSSWTTGSI